MTLFIYYHSTTSISKNLKKNKTLSKKPNTKTKSDTKAEEVKRRNWIIAWVVILALYILGSSTSPHDQQPPSTSPTPEPTATATATPEEKPAEPTPTLTLDKDKLADACTRVLFIKGYKNASLVYFLDYSTELFDGLGYYTKDRREVFHVRGPIKTPGGEDVLYSCYTTADANIMLVRVKGREVEGSWDLLYDRDGDPILDD